MFHQMVLDFYKKRPDDFDRRVRWLRHLLSINEYNPTRAKELRNKVFSTDDNELDDIFQDFDQLDLLDKLGLAIFAMKNENPYLSDTQRVKDVSQVVLPPPSRKSIMDDIYRSILKKPPIHVHDERYVRVVYPHRIQQTAMIIESFGRLGNRYFETLDELKRQHVLTQDTHRTSLLKEAHIQVYRHQYPYKSGECDNSALLQLMVPCEELYRMTLHEVKWVSTKLWLFIMSTIPIETFYTLYSMLPKDKEQELEEKRYISDQMARYYPNYEHTDVGMLIQDFVVQTTVPELNRMDDKSIVEAAYVAACLYETYYISKRYNKSVSPNMTQCNKDVLRDIVAPYFKLNENDHIVFE